MNLSKPSRRGYEDLLAIVVAGIVAWLRPDVADAAFAAIAGIVAAARNRHAAAKN